MFYKLTATEVINSLIDEVVNSNPQISRSKAKTLVLNALVANCVIEDIMKQVEFLNERNGYEE